MLTHLQIENFIIIEKSELEFKKGLTVITGETGSGKSIAIDALTLVLGDRADNNLIGPFQEKLDLTACFNVNAIPAASQWLKKNDFGAEPWTECILRRIVQSDGKSRQMINGYSCTLQQLREFVPLLVNIHSQNQQQLLTKRSHQRELLDLFANHASLCEEVKNCYHQWLDNEKQLNELTLLGKNVAVQQELLEYQLNEFDKLGLLPDEYAQLDKEHKQLANAGQLIKNCEDTLQLLSESEKHAVQTNLYHAHNSLEGIKQYDQKLNTASELINHAIIHLEEAVSELRAFMHQIEINPDRLNLVEKRLSKLHELARKYQTSPQELLDINQKLKDELTALLNAKEQIVKLTLKSDELKTSYWKAAKKLHTSRQVAANQLSDRITSDLQKLGMPGGIFKVMVNQQTELTSNGSDEIDFLVATNPGQSLQPLPKIASGGEISRIALAIYVATAEKTTTPILIFDEVDVGIGGSTAAIVGRLLKMLSLSVQIICITHLPQVAAYGDQHFCVQKKVGEKTTTEIIALKPEEKITEIARMLGGMTITEKTLAHAKELIALA